MRSYCLLHLFAYITASAYVAAQSSGQWTINITDANTLSSDPSSGTSSCILLAQLPTLSSPDTITALKPICGPASPFPTFGNPSESATLTLTTGVNWPLSNDGDGDFSSLAIYAQIDERGVPGCVMYLRQMQVVYILGRDLEWRVGEGSARGGRLYDRTAGDYITDPETVGPMEW
jgi:hypothetical protein